jgi:hypothetical protein
VVHDNFSAYSQLGAQGEQRFQDNSNPIKEHRIMLRYVFIIDTARKQKINEFEALRDIVASKSVFGLG